jgi:hypothetical protein
MDGFEAQRTWFQAEALYTPEYSDVFAGGFVFEYSSEKDVVDSNLQFFADRNNGVFSSEWPYEKFAKVNYGMGYFSPVDCQHDDGSGDDTNTPCEYKKYPEWDGLVEVYAKSDAKIVRAQNPGAIPACPGRFQPLSFYDWPTDEEKDPDLEYCLELKRNEDASKDEPTRAPTKNPTASPDDERAATDSPTAIDEPTATTDGDSSTAATDAPSMVPTSESIQTVFSTLSPTAEPTKKNSSAPTILTGQDITTISPTLPPTLRPTLSPTVSPTLSPTMEPTTTPDSSPTMGPTITPSMTTNLMPTLSPSSSPTAEPTGNQTAQCSFHPVCSLSGLAGACCPTLDGVILGCCDNFEVSSARGVVFYHHLLVVSGLAVVLASW